jgi:hypothetical protein
LRADENGTSPASASGADGHRAATASVVLLRAVADAPARTAPRRPRPRSPRRAGDGLDLQAVGRQRPVLSRHSTSTWLRTR